MPTVGARLHLWLRPGLLMLTWGLAWAGGLPGAVVRPTPFGAVDPSLPPPRFPFRSLGYPQGLLNISVRRLAQDAEGFLWVGTEHGLFRYDGAEFRAYGLDDGLPGLFIQALGVAPEGALWIGTDQGLAYHYRGRLHAVPGSLGHSPIRTLACEPGGLVWVGNDAGLQVGTREGGFQPAPGWTQGAARMLLAAQGGLWASGPEGLLRGGGSSRTRSWEPAAGLAGQPMSLATDGSGRVWAHTGDRLWRAEAGSVRFSAEPTYPARPRQPSVRLFVDRQDRLWVTGLKGVDILDGGRWSRFSAAQGFPSDWVRDLCQGVDGSIWIGALGLHQLVGQEAWTYYNRADGLPSDMVGRMLRDRRGTLWAGTMAGMARGTPGGWVPLPGLEGIRVLSVLELPDGRLAASGFPMALYTWDPRGGPVTRVPLPVPTTEQCVGMVLDARGDLWICGSNRGALIARPRGAGWSFRWAGLPGGEYDSIARDTEGGLWVSEQRALFYFDGVSWLKYAAPEGIPANPFAVRALAHGEVLVAFRGNSGWARVRHAKGRLEILEHRTGSERLNPDLVYLAGLDARGRLWLGGGQGAERIDGAASRFFGMGDGLAHHDLNDDAFLAEADGSVWLGTSAGGLARYRPGPQEAPPPPPVARIWKASQGGRWLDATTAAPHPVSWKSPALELHFSAPAFVSPQQLELQTRLLGSPSDWSATESRVARFQGLLPGRYRFEVRARLRGGAWGPVAGFPFQVLPPWWLSWPALGAALAAVALSVWGLVRLRTLRLARRNQRLREQIAEATEEIRVHQRHLEAQAQILMNLDAQKNQFLGIVAHELRTPLARIAMTAELLEDEEDPEEVSLAARSIFNESRDMSTMVGRFLDIAALEDGKVAPECADQPLAPLFAEVQARHQARAEEKGLELGVEMPGPEVRVFADRRFTLEILNNLVGNALKFSPPGGRIRLWAEPEAEDVLMSVSDQGPGMTPEDLACVFGRYVTLSARPTGGEKATGLGLFIVKRMAEAQGGRVEVRSQAGAGATFQVRLPGWEPSSRP